jgi:hypothetical protein
MWAGEVVTCWCHFWLQSVSELSSWTQPDLTLLSYKFFRKKIYGPAWQTDRQRGRFCLKDRHGCQPADHYIAGHNQSANTTSSRRVLHKCV